MRAIVVTRHGGPEVLEIRELPDPVPGAGEVLVRVRAFGLNHADVYMRSGVWDFGEPVLGIECAGVVADDPERTARRRDAGGRARRAAWRARGHGSYAELVAVPASNVVPVHDDARLARARGAAGELRDRLDRAARQPRADVGRRAAGARRHGIARPGGDQHRRTPRRRP